jgi:plastocyanin domain-containing protein
MIKKFFEKHEILRKYLLPICVGVFFLASISGVIFINQSKNNDDDSPSRSMKTIDTLVDTKDKQVIEMTVKGNGYSPSTLTAKADEPIILRTVAKSAFGCASLVTIPSLKIRKDLPINGTTDIEIPAQASNTILKGTCLMGMYSFKIEIK